MENMSDKDFYEDEDAPQSLLIREKGGGWNHKERLYLIGAGILILLILLIAVWPDGASQDKTLASAEASGNLGAIAVRFDAIDQRLTEIETRLNRTGESADAAGTAGADTERSIENGQRIDQILARLETLDRRLDDIRKAVKNRPAVHASEPAASSRTKTASRQYYEVKKGDTLYSIARNHDVALQALMKLNGLNSRSVLHPGDRVRIK